MRVAFAATLLAAMTAPAFGQSQTVETWGAYRLTVNYDRPGLTVPHWQIKIVPHSPAEYTGKPSKGVDPGIIFFAISDAGSERLADMLHRSHDLQPCETKTKGIANMGTKTLDYAPEGGPESHCEYNFTDNKPLSDAFEYVLAIAQTLQTGVELDRLHRYDRLGLDPLMIRLVTDVKEGHAAELGAIRPTLESLATDVAVMERVRTRAQQLLDMAGEQNKAVQ